MPNYVNKSLAIFQHKKPKHDQHSDMFRADVANTVTTISILDIFPLTFIFDSSRRFKKLMLMDR